MQPTIRAKMKTAIGECEMIMPQNQFEFDAALNDFGVPTCAKGEYKILSATSNVPELDNSIANARDIEELNHLAQRLNGFNDSEIETYSALVKAQDASMTMPGLINLTYNLHDYNIEPSITDIQELGEKYVELESPDLPEHIFENLDFEGIGMDVQTEHGGVFTDEGYCSNFNQAFEQKYDGKYFPDYDYESSYQLKIRLSDGIGDQQKGVYVNLPASQTVFDRAINRLGVNNLGDCIITDYQSWRHEKFDHIFSPHEDISKLNELAEILDLIPQDREESYFKALKNDEQSSDIDKLIGFTKNFVDQGQEKAKPDCPLIGANGNVFNIMGIASKTLKRAGMPDEAKEMCDKIMQSGSYSEALNIIGDYVNITDSTQEQNVCDGPQMNM